MSDGSVMINGINDELILAARLLLATLFLIFGWRKLRDFPGTVSQMVQLGVPTPVLAAAGSESLLVHLNNSGFIFLSGDVVHLEENFEKDTVPSLNTDKAASIASMERIRRMIATYKAKFFINHDKIGRA